MWCHTEIVTFPATQIDMRERVTFGCWTGAFTGLLKQRSYIITVTQHLGACLTSFRKRFQQVNVVYLGFDRFSPENFFFFFQNKELYF